MRQKVSGGSGSSSLPGSPTRVEICVSWPATTVILKYHRKWLLQLFYCCGLNTKREEAGRTRRKEKDDD